MKSAAILLLALGLSCAGSRGREDAAVFPRAVEPRVFEFPRDHGSHPEYRTEWWYLTGALETEGGEVFGFQATWFRRALKPEAPARASTLAARDLILFHGALADVGRQAFAHDHAIARAASTWAGAAEGDLKVWLFENRLERRTDGSWALRFEVQGRRVELTLMPQRAPLLHGAAPGLSLKGPEPGQASYYYSQTRLVCRGALAREPGAEPLAVRGQAWFDQEFGSNQLAADQIGWDWFSAALDDGTDLMLYLLRHKDGTVEPLSGGTLRFNDGRRVHLKRGDVKVEVLARWTSPHTQAEYPAKWKLAIPAEKIELEVAPLVPDQELRTPGASGVNYWEGLCRFDGKVGPRPAKGRGYVELVGYAGAFLGGL
ncbi:MAG: carotenoid 1,2-hydratase [Planctomycetota bacterium]|nr:carotenoid 1,2-hydratase [Planctomycetota bacterium]